MPHRRTLIVHIGLEKTATTSFQRFCTDHQGELRDRGLLYPRGALQRGINHKRLAASYLVRLPPDPTLALGTPARGTEVRRILQEVEASDAPDRILVSSEHFSSRFQEAEVTEFAEDFAAFDCEILVALRDPYARFLSSYGTYVLGGGRMALSDYVAVIFAPGNRYMRMRETLEPWVQVFGAERVRILDYDATADVLSALLEACGVSGAAPDVSRYRDLASPRTDVVQALRLVHHAIAERQGDGPNLTRAAWLQLMAFSALCRRWLVRAAAGLPRTPLPLGPEGMRHLDETAERDRLWLEATFGMVLHGAAARNRIVVDDAPPDALTAERLLAEALLRQIPPGAWAVSEGLVRVWERLSHEPRIPRP